MAEWRIFPLRLTTFCLILCFVTPNTGAPIPMSMYFRVTANALAHVFAAGALMVGLYALFS